MSQDNVALVRRWFEEVWNQRRGETIDELIPADSVCHADDGPLRGPDEFRARQFGPFLAAFPDLRVTVESILADGDEVAVRWTATGTHAGDGLGFRATHEPATFCGMSWIRVKDGKLGEGWQSSNIPAVVQGLSTKALAL